MAKLAIDGGEKIRTDPFPPWPHFFDDEIAEVQNVLREGKVNYWTGERGRRFQQEFAEFCGAKHGIAVMNGTAALHVALAAAEVGPGDEVIDSAGSGQTGGGAGGSRGATGRRKIVLIEDSAQAQGAEYKGKRTGVLGDIAAFSFCNDKIFTTGGEGGMVTTNSDEMAEIARSFKDHGYREEERRNLLELEALYTYIHHRMGYNQRMTEMQAAIGLRAMEKIDWNLNRRRENAHYLTEKLGMYDGLIPPVIRSTDRTTRRSSSRNTRTSSG